VQQAINIEYVGCHMYLVPGGVGIQLVYLNQVPPSGVSMLAVAHSG